MKKIKIIPIILLVIINIIFFKLPSHAFFENYDDVKKIGYFGGREFSLSLSRNEDRSTPRRMLYKLNFSNGSKEIFFSSKNTLSQIELSPNKLNISVKENIRSGFNKEFANKLLIFNLKGELIHEIKKGKGEGAIMSYVWSPNGNKIAYIAGYEYKVERKDTVYNYESNGLYIYDLEKEAETKISDFAYELKWAKFNGNLYFGSYLDTYKYDVKNKKIEKINYKSTNLSPDGKYYAILNIPLGEGILSNAFFEIYSNENEKLYELSTQRERNIYVRDLFWCGDSKHLINKITGKSFIYNAEEGNIIRRIKGYLIGWNNGLTKLVTYHKKEKKFVVEDTFTGEKIAEYSEKN
jgi:hypothetical protein